MIKDWNIKYMGNKHVEHDQYQHDSKCYNTDRT